jgi:hypothetical protein
MSLPSGWGASISIWCGGMVDSEAGAIPVNCSQTRWHNRLEVGGLAASVAIRCGDSLDLEAGVVRCPRRWRHAWLGVGTVGLGCDLMRRHMGPRGVGGRRQLESEPWCDRLGMGCDEPRGCHYRWWCSDLIGGGGVIPGNRRRRELDLELGVWGIALRLWLGAVDSTRWPTQNRPAWLYHQPIC